MTELPRVVADATYKAEKPAGFPQADLYQLLAYCTVLGLSDGHVIYAKGEEQARVHEVVGSQVRIHCHALDLTVPPVALLEQVLVLAARMQRIRLRRPAPAARPQEDFIRERHQPKVLLP